MKRLKLLIIIIAIGLCGVVETSAGIIINEVMSNEPGGDVKLEWIELYNNSSETELLSDYILQIGDDSLNPETEIHFDDTLTMAAYEYFILCRKLIPNGTSSGFEGYWGDSSLVWGDTYQESQIRRPVEFSFSLKNSSGTIWLLDKFSSVVSRFSWDRSGEDGVSWERFSPTSGIIEQSTDPDGATPGRVNSSTPVDKDLTLFINDIHLDNEETVVTIEIQNVGNETISNGQLFIYEINTSDTQTIETITLPALQPSETLTVERRYLFDNYYSQTIFQLTDDDRPGNNRVVTVVPGNDFPPLKLSEILANPTIELHTEWVELVNHTDTAIDLNGWQIGDSVSLRRIVDYSFLLFPGEYVVLADDSDNFIQYYTDFDGMIIQPPQWPTLNNNGDIVRLVDPYGFAADSFSYNRAFSQNYTWGRGEDIDHENKWGVSEQPGGSPGEPNSVLLAPNASHISMTISPNIISPDGDGIDDYASIIVGAPPDNEYELKIYDRQGRVVYTFDRVLDENEWNGHSSAGNRLPVGIYLVYFEVEGGGSVKKPIVIAR